MADDQSRDEIASELEALRAERAMNLATANKARLDALAEKTARGLEDNRRQSDYRLEQRANHDRGVAVELAEHTATRDREFAARREEAASKLAYERGADAARLEARFDKIEFHQATVNGSIAKTGQALERLDTSIEQMFLDQAKRDAATLALAAELASRTSTQVTARQFTLGLIALVVSIGGLLLAVSGGI